MFIVLILYMTLVSLIFSVVLQFFISSSWWQTGIIVACFWVAIFYLMDFIVLVFLRAKAGKRYNRHHYLGNMNILAGFKRSKVYISNVLPQHIILLEGAIGQKILVLGEQLAALLSQEEIKSLTIFYFSLANKRGLKSRTFLTSIVIFFYWLSSISKVTKKVFNFYFFQIFQVLQVFPLNEEDLKSCEKLVESFLKTKRYLESGKRKVFSRNDPTVSLAEKIVFPISTNGNFHQLIIDTVRINFNEPLAE